MKIILQNADKVVLRLDKNEEFFACFTQFMTQQGIKACTFSAIGACTEVELAFFNTFTKIYRRKPYLEQLEIVSLSGNGGLKDGQPFLHVHGVFGRNDFTTLAGHVFKLVISVSCEIVVSKLEGEMKRESDTEFYLNLLS